MGRFLAALSFLSIIPVKPDSYNDEDFHSCQRYFIVVGLMIGGMAAMTGWMLCQVLPGLAAAVLATGLLIVFSGGLHLDGLADSADGLLSHRPKGRILEIMKDSRIGSFGTVALILLLLTKGTSLAGIGGGNMWQGLLLAPICGRAAMTLQKKFLPTARPEGMGANIGGKVRGFDLLAAFLLPAVVGLAVCGSSGLIAVALALLATGIGFSHFVRDKIGGYTGDTLGASSEIAEALCLLGLCLHLP